MRSDDKYIGGIDKSCINRRSWFVREVSRIVPICQFCLMAIRALNGEGCSESIMPCYLINITMRSILVSALQQINQITCRC